MRVAIAGEEFARERERWALRFTCADCFHRDDRTGRCAHEWPDEAHRAPPPPEATEVVFCKEFELR